MTQQAKIQTDSPSGGVPAIGWNITRVAFNFFLFFCDHNFWSCPDTKPANRFLPQNTPKMGVNRHFQAKLAKHWNWHINETNEPIQTKFCTVTETTKICFVGGPNRRITNPRWRTAEILKNQKWPYLRNALTDMHKIWHNNAFWPSEGYGQLKFPTFRKSKMADGRHLEKSKTAISPQRLDLFAQHLARWRILALRRISAVKISNFWKSKMADGRHLDKFNKRPYLRNGLTDVHEIWQGGANWHCKAYWQSEFQTSENPLPSHLLPSLRPFPFPLLFSCSLPSPLNPSHSSTVPSLTLSSPASSPTFP